MLGIYNLPKIYHNKTLSKKLEGAYSSLDG